MDQPHKTITIRKKIFFRIARDLKEYEKDVVPTEEVMDELEKADVFTFIERRWSNTIQAPEKTWVKTSDNIGLLEIKDYGDWLKKIGKKTRNMIRKAEKSGIATDKAEPNEKLAEGIWRIYNETPIRQERGFPYYGISLETVKDFVLSAQNCTYIGAWLQHELVGIIQLVYGDNIIIISLILSLQKHWDKAINNALVAKAVEICAEKNDRWLMYGRMGNHPTLDNFKQNNAFTRYTLTRYYIPLTRRGKVAIKLGLHREMKDRLPQPLKYVMMPLYNWLSRNRMRSKHQKKPEMSV